MDHVGFEFGQDKLDHIDIFERNRIESGWTGSNWVGSGFRS
jgi:hypothetical protein